MENNWRSFEESYYYLKVVNDWYKKNRSANLMSLVILGNCLLDCL